MRAHTNEGVTCSGVVCGCLSEEMMESSTAVTVGRARGRARGRVVVMRDNELRPGTDVTGAQRELERLAVRKGGRTEGQTKRRGALLFIKEPHMRPSHITDKRGESVARVHVNNSVQRTFSCCFYLHV